MLIVNLLSRLYIPPWLGKILKFMVIRFLENAFEGQNIEYRLFYSCLPVRTQYSPLFPPGSAFSKTNVFGIRKNIFACLFSVHNTISLSRHEQVCLMRLRFERYFSHHRAM